MNKKTLSNLRKLVNNKKYKTILKTIRVLGGPMRFKILAALYSHRDGLINIELARLFNASRSRISHQLNILRKHKLISGRKINREIVYTAANHRIQKLLRF
jgi:DNA-binding transcriptional ArsR family regulator